jgi:hypothetical protein
MDSQTILGALGLLGIGTAVGSFFTKRWELSNTIKLQQQEFKFGRYKVIILLMYSALDFEKEKDKLKQHHRNFETLDELLDELKAEWHNMILFASDRSLKKTKAFIKSPTYQNFCDAAIALRKDLWGSKTSIKFDDDLFR